MERNDTEQDSKEYYIWQALFAQLKMRKKNISSYSKATIFQIRILP